MKKIFFLFGFVLMSLTLLGAGCISFTSDKQTTSGPLGMYVSTNKGDTWQTLNALPKADGVKNISGVDVYRLFTDPGDPDAFYLASRQNGLFYTYDAGNTWQQPRKMFSGGYIYSLVVHPKNKCTIYITNGTQVYRSDDCLRSFTEVYRESRSDARIISLAIDFFPPHRLFLAENNGDLLQSFDTGYSWSTVKRFKTRIIQILPSPLTEKLVFLVTKDEGLLRSRDNGETWENLSGRMKQYSGSLEYRRFLLHATKPNTLYWVSTYGILRSDDQGDTWTPYELITPPGSADIYGFAVNPQNDNEIYYTATIGTKSTFYRSIDGGKNWVTKKLPSGQIPTILYPYSNDTNVLFLGFSVLPSKKK
ncbi:MAG TPA: hypothetical protein VJB37_01015 [Patescibacteria group bacterium]|nr:hypothetical protein [Patescibacteria group bacterium]